MKRTKYLFLAFFAVLFILNGCSKEENLGLKDEKIATEDISISDVNLAQMHDDVLNKQILKNGDIVFKMTWVFGPTDDTYFFAKRDFIVSNKQTERIYTVTYYWDETLAGTNKWSLFPDGNSGSLRSWAVFEGDALSIHHTNKWNKGDRESFACAVYQYNLVTGVFTLLAVEFKIDVVINDFVN